MNECVNECVFGEGSSLALVSYPSSDGVTIKIPYGVDVLHRPGRTPFIPIGLMLIVFCL